MGATALGPPPASLATDTGLPSTVLPTRPLFRISPFKTGEPHFGCSGANRFDAPGCLAGAPEFRTCYFGMSLEVAIAESLLHDEVAVDGVFRLSVAALEQRFLHRFQGRALRVLDLTGSLLKRLGGHAGLAGSASYATTQQWAVAVFQNPLSFDGFIYMSRHLNTGRAVVLFDRAAFKLQARPSPLALPDVPGFADAAKVFNIMAV